MRNLQVIDIHRVGSVKDLVGSQCLTVDYDTKYVYCATPYAILCLDVENQQLINQVSLVELDFMPADGSCRIVGIQSLLDESSICVATSTGDVLLWNSLSNDVECVGSVDSGLTCMVWSPDQELVVLVTGQETLIMMTREFLPITETPMHPDEFGEGQFVNVGWGKKETQFHGSVGKQAAKEKAGSVEAARPWDDAQPRISWRGDGQYFAVSSIDPSLEARKMRVWTRECQLFSTGENINGMEQALAWKPSGGLVASSQRKPNKHDIIFMEKNGLQHGEFTLPFKANEVKVRELLWNLDSSVLAVWCEELKREDCGDHFTPKSYVQLWTCGNYHWYLKQSFQFPGISDEQVAAVLWDTEHPLKIHIQCQGGRYQLYTLAKITNHSVGLMPDDMANVAVIDNEKILMTPFKRMIVPPPMSAYTLSLPKPISQVAFAPPPCSNDLAVLMEDGSVAFYLFDADDNSKDNSVTLQAAGGNGFKTMCSAPSFSGLYSCDVTPSTSLSCDIYHMQWIEKCSLLLCTYQADRNQTIIHHMHIDCEAQKLCSVGSADTCGHVLGITSNPQSGTVAVQMVDGQILQYNKESHCIEPWTLSDGTSLQFPIACTQWCVCTVGGLDVVLGLTERFRFYMNNIELANNCSSFAIHDDFILYTTNSHTCICISRDTSVKEFSSWGDGKSEALTESVRQVERGSRIVHIVPTDTKVILQMPRGNLETIHPRALVLSAVKKSIDRLEYKDAFLLMKKHRINMNLLHDHDPESLLNNLETFVRKVESVDHINLFLTHLQQEDVTTTTYKAYYKQEATSEVKSDKVNRVCDRMLAALEKVDPDKYLLCVLTAYVRKSTPDLETALLKVRSLKGCSQQAAVGPEEALNYLLFLVDVNELYDVALGTYDFDLVLMVAEKSQKDPKEYLPFLNNLRVQEDNYQRFLIDKHLKRYSKALEHISQCGEERFEECLNLVQNHRLFSKGMTLFAKSSSEYKEIALKYGDYLLENKQYEEAGLIYSKASASKQALESYEKCSNWRQVMCLAADLKYSPTEVADLARRMAARLKENGHHLDAACLLEHYAEDVEEAIVTLIEGLAWQEALRVMYKYGRKDFIETDLKVGLQSHFSLLVNMIESNRNDFERHKARLAVVQKEKEKAALELLNMEGHFNDADADLFSDTSSATGESVRSAQSTGSTKSTVFSRTSSRTSKNRRKAERKKWSLKEGSAHEDFALLEALAAIVKQMEDSKKDMCEFLKALVMFDYDALAQELQEKFGQFLSLIETSIPEIWNPDKDNDNSAIKGFGPQMTANSIALAMQGKPNTPGSQQDLPQQTTPTFSKDTKWKLHIVTTRDK